MHTYGKNLGNVENIILGVQVQICVVKILLWGLS